MKVENDFGNDDYNKMLIGDIYHWEKDSVGNLTIKANSQKGAELAV